MKGIQNFLLIINENWTTIVVCIGLAIGIYKKVKDYILMTDQQKIEIAKTQITEVILQMVLKAEGDYAEWNKAGKLKRAQVINQIFDTYPILNKVVEQDEVIEWIDELINSALEELKTIVSKQDSN
jgi:hypothetical protein